MRVGRVDFINTFPLAWSLGNRLADGAIEEVLGVPTELNALLADGAIDVANVSSIEYARHADRYVLLPSVCISSDGAVESVNLVTDVPLPAVRSIAVTAKSAASEPPFTRDCRAVSSPCRRSQRSSRSARARHVHRCIRLLR